MRQPLFAISTPPKQQSQRAPWPVHTRRAHLSPAAAFSSALMMDSRSAIASLHVRLAVHFIADATSFGTCTCTTQQSEETRTRRSPQRGSKQNGLLLERVRLTQRVNGETQLVLLIFLKRHTTCNANHMHEGSKPSLLNCGCAAVSHSMRGLTNNCMRTCACTGRKHSQLARWKREKVITLQSEAKH